MTILSCYVDEDTLRSLRMASDQTGRKVEELAEAAIASAAIEFKVSQPGYGKQLTAYQRPEAER